MLLFFVAWNMLLSRSRYVSVGSMFVFMVSFYTWSMIPFFLLPIANIVALEFNRRKKVDKFVIAKGGLIVLAPGYYLISRVVWPPAIERADYFTPQIGGVVRAAIFFAAALLFSYWVLFRRTAVFELEAARLLAVGSLCLAAGSVAYFASGRLVDLSEWLSFIVPRSSDWDSRSQLLHGLGLALCLTGLIICIDLKLRATAINVVFIACLLLNNSIMTGYYLDFLKQEAVIEAISAEPLVSSSRVILIDDIAPALNARGRGLRSYEWEGLILKSIGQHKQVITSSYIDCEVGLEIPDLLVTIESRRGRLKTMLMMNADIALRVKIIEPCAG